MVFEFVVQAQYVHVVCDAQVVTNLIPFYVQCADDDDNLRTVRKLLKHTHLRVPPESRQNPACVIIVKKFTSEFEVQFISELRNALFNVFGLNF